MDCLVVNEIGNPSQRQSAEQVSRLVWITHANWFVVGVAVGIMYSMACLDQLLIAIISLTLLCDHSRSKTRLITVMSLIAQLGIIYATACHTSLCTTELGYPIVSCHCRRTALTTIYKHGTGSGRLGLASQLQRQLALWVFMNVCVKYCAGCH